MNFMNPQYLATGSTDQQKAWEALRELRVFERLSLFKPVLAGTFPLDLAVDGSDLDILCEVSDFEAFQRVCRGNFAGQKDFRISSREINGLASTIVRFEAGDLLFEIFAQSQPVEMQDAYRHMVVEWELLQTTLKGRAQDIRRLKNEGLTTEESFAALLHMEGDPYRGLIDLGVARGLFS